MNSRFLSTITSPKALRVDLTKRVEKNSTNKAVVKASVEAFLFLPPEWRQRRRPEGQRFCTNRTDWGRWRMREKLAVKYLSLLRTKKGKNHPAANKSASKHPPQMQIWIFHSAWFKATFMKSHNIWFREKGVSDCAAVSSSSSTINSLLIEVLTIANCFALFSPFSNLQLRTFPAWAAQNSYWRTLSQTEENIWSLESFVFNAGNEGEQIIPFSCKLSAVVKYSAAQVTVRISMKYFCNFALSLFPVGEIL